VDNIKVYNKDGGNKTGSKRDYIVLLDNLRSSYNVGNIIRVVEAFGFREICFTGITACPPHKKIMKTAMGAENHIEFRYFRESADGVMYYKKRAYPIISLERTNRSIKLMEFPFKSKGCIVLGNEALGINTRILELSDAILEIPMYGFKNSINVSNAFSMLAYEIVKEKKRIKGFDIL